MSSTRTKKNESIAKAKTNPEYDEIMREFKQLAMTKVGLYHDISLAEMQVKKARGELQLLQGVMREKQRLTRRLEERIVTLAQK